MDKYSRLTGLLELLTKRGKLEIDEVALELGVSAATIRRDFDHLAQQQLLTRTRGGAVSNSVSYDLPLRYKTSRHADEKLRIGEAAAGLVRRGCVLGLTGGTTSTEVARAITARGSLQILDGDPAVTIVTNAVNIANELTVRPQVKIVMTGGVARPQSYELIGPLAERTLTELTLDLAILGVNGIDASYGASADDEGEAAVNALMAARASRVVVVADSSKLGHRAFARVCPIADIDTLITDVRATDAQVDLFEKSGIDIRRV
jgi:DeoR family transcriptional regulator, aga operon transcriptional repressor